MTIAAEGLIGLLRDRAYLRVWLVGVFSGVARWLESLADHHDLDVR